MNLKIILAGKIFFARKISEIFIWWEPANFGRIWQNNQPEIKDNCGNI
jgi:hypothetical protein